MHVFFRVYGCFACTHPPDYQDAFFFFLVFCHFVTLEHKIIFYSCYADIETLKREQESER